MSLSTNQRIVILGGSRGIGKAIVERFARTGAEVVFTYSSSAVAAEAIAKEHGATAYRVDAGNRVELSEFIREQSPIDVLVVNAGRLVMGDPLELDPHDIDQMIDVNVRGPYFAAVEAARWMNEGSRIIVIGSVNADRMPMEGGAAYAMTKAAIQGMVQGLARDLGPKKITVNNVQPGPTDTDMNPADGPFSEVMHSFMALKRHGKPSEIAAMVQYLAGPEASFITGAHFSVDGGFSA